MPPTIGYRFGDIVLVPFPFTDQSASKKRPAVVAGSDSYNVHRRDIVLMAITSQVGARVPFGEAGIREWKKAGLLKPGVVRPIFAMVARAME